MESNLPRSVRDETYQSGRRARERASTREKDGGKERLPD
jgi:hypothetical protein